MPPHYHRTAAMLLPPISVQRLLPVLYGSPLLIKEGGVQSVANVDMVRRSLLLASFILGHQDGLELHVIVLLPT